MLRLLRFLVTGSWHLHSWAPIEAGPVLGERGTKKGMIYVSRCKECGKISKTQINAR